LLDLRTHAPSSLHHPTAPPTPPTNCNPNRLAREQLTNELADARDALAAESAARAELANRLESVRTETAETRRELDAAKTVRGGVRWDGGCTLEGLQLVNAAS